MEKPDRQTIGPNDQDWGVNGHTDVSIPLTYYKMSLLWVFLPKSTISI